MTTPTAETGQQNLSDLLDALIDTEGAITDSLFKVQDAQKTLGLILIGTGLQTMYPGAELLQVEIGPTGVKGVVRGPVAVELTDADGNVLASGHELANTPLDGWTAGELLAELAVRNDGTWIKDVASEHDDHWGECDCSIYLDGMEPFAIDLTKAAALPVPGNDPETILESLRAGLLSNIPDASTLYCRFTQGQWRADDLADVTGAGLRTGEPLAMEPIPGGDVGQAVAKLAEQGHFDRVLGMNRPPAEGTIVGISITMAAQQA